MDWGASTQMKTPAVHGCELAICAETTDRHFRKRNIAILGSEMPPNQEVNLRHFRK